MDTDEIIGKIENAISIATNNGEIGEFKDALEFLRSDRMQLPATFSLHSNDEWFRALSAYWLACKYEELEDPNRFDNYVDVKDVTLGVYSAVNERSFD